MHSVNVVPDWRDSDAASIGDWWRDMAERTGTVFHPDDPPAEIVDIKGNVCFSAGACNKLNRILDRMVLKYGDVAYAEAHKVFMARLGWVEPSAGDGWIRAL